MNENVVISVEQCVIPLQTFVFAFYVFCYLSDNHIVNLIISLWHKVCGIFFSRIHV